MTRAALPDRLRVDAPVVPVDDAFVAVLAAHAAGSHPTSLLSRARSRYAVVLVAAAVAATTLGAAWAARESTARPPAPATHERRVQPAPAPAPAHPRKTRPITRELVSDDAAPARRDRPASRPTGPATATVGPVVQPRSAPPVTPPTRRNREAVQPHQRAEDPAGDRPADGEQPTGTTRDGTDDGTDDGTHEGAGQTDPGTDTERTDGATDDDVPSGTEHPDGEVGDGGRGD